MTEILGAHVAVSDSSHPGLVGLCGTAVVETAHTISIDVGSLVPLMLPKNTCTFEVDGILVKGSSLGRPERRM